MKLIFRNNFFIAETQYDERLIPKKAAFRWDPTGNDCGVKKRWWTDDAEKAYKLIEYADKICTEEIKRRLDAKVRAIEESRLTNKNINCPSPNNLEYLPFQKAGISYLKSHKDVLLADEMGLGKTIQVIGFINLTKPNKILIVCPASLKLNWKRELKKWLVHEYSIEVLNGSTKATADILICNYDILYGTTKAPRQSWLQKENFDLFVCDEAHFAKNYKAKRSKAVYSIAKKSKKNIFLTGTPIVNRPIELYPIISALGFNMKFWPYAMRYCNAYQGQYGWDLSGASNLDELQNNLRASLMIRRLKHDVLKELPDKQRQVIELNQQKYQTLLNRETKLIETYASRLNKINNIKNKKEDFAKIVLSLEEEDSISFSELSKLRHEIGLKKVSDIVEHIKMLLDETDKVVVFAHHRDVIANIQKEFENISVSLVGGDSLESREEAVKEFQTNKNIKLFIGSIKAAGVGITLNVADTVVFAELCWRPGDIIQAEDRLHRIGQKNNVLVQYLVVNGSLDAHIAKTFVEKQTVINKALDIDAGFNFDEAGTKIKEVKKINNHTNNNKKEVVQSKYSSKIKTLVLGCLRTLAQTCDGAISIDEKGFNKFDSEFGHDLANKTNLTDKQTEAAINMLKKYKKQLDESVYEQIFKTQ